MTGRVVGALLVREGSYAVQVRLTHRLLPGAKLEPVPLIDGDVLDSTALMLDAIALTATGCLPPDVHVFQVMEA